jgi:acetyltransferase
MALWARAGRNMCSDSKKKKANLPSVAALLSPPITQGSAMDMARPPIALSANDILSPRQPPLHSFFAPASVAVIGATETEGSVGRTVLWNLISSPFGGTVFPVNPKRASVLGIKAYPQVSDVPGGVELAVIVTPAPSVPDIIGVCARANVRAAIIISAGFKECGPAGMELESQVRAQLVHSRLRVMGPNCLGVMSPSTGLNATFAAGMARPGTVACISQSGALLTAILDWSLQENVGFSCFVSLGSMLDVGWGDLMDYLGDDPHTQSIVIYMESIGDARSFLSAAREVTQRKPVIVIKAGRTEAAARAAASHTGALAGSDDVLEAAFRRCGVLRVKSIADLFHMSDVLCKQPRPAGPRLTILTNAGGPGVLATDALIAGGGELSQLSEDSISALNGFLPPQWSHGNPVDILGDAAPERYARAVEILARDPNSDGLLVVLTPQAMTDPTHTAECLKKFARSQRPILASWMGGSSVEGGLSILARANIPAFPYPDTAAKVFLYMWRYSYNLRGLYETPSLTEIAGGGKQSAHAIIESARSAGRTILTEFESKQVLAAYDIPAVRTEVASSEAEAVRLADHMGYPVALKLHSLTITHKTDVGGVQLDLGDEAAVRRAYRFIADSVIEKAGAEHFAGVTVQPMIKLEGYELIIGSSVDAQFGPVLLFGAGAQLVEVFHDRALALPPLNTTLARRLMEQTRIYTALKGVRGRKPVDLEALEQVLVRFSQLVVEERKIKEIDINPLLASPDRLAALDARIVLHDPGLPERSLPSPAIRPYPNQYVSDWDSKSGVRFTIRPIRPEDEPLIARFHETLSEQSVYLRYIQALKLSQRVAHGRLARLSFIDYDREMALVAERKDPLTGSAELAGIARLIKQHGRNEAEFALLVSDRFQGSGLGTELLRRLLQVGRDERLRLITADILPENRGMQRLCEKLGIGMRHVPKERLVKAEIEL